MQEVKGGWDLVISKYKEDVSWISKTEYNRFNKIVYNKDSEFDFIVDGVTCINIPNVGREGHTYLYHIVENYESLAELTIFLPGSCMDEFKVTSTNILLSRVQETRDTVIPGKWYTPDVATMLKDFNISVWSGSNESNKSNLPEKRCRPSFYSPFGRWYRHYFGDVKINVACFNSMFAVSRSHILQKPKAHYESLLNCVNDHSNPEDGHFLERSWQAVFYPIPDSCLHSARPIQQVKSRQVEPSLAGKFSDRLSSYKSQKRKAVEVETAGSDLTTQVVVLDEHTHAKKSTVSNQASAGTRIITEVDV